MPYYPIAVLTQLPHFGSDVAKKMEPFLQGVDTVDIYFDTPYRWNFSIFTDEERKLVAILRINKDTLEAFLTATDSTVIAQVAYVPCEIPTTIISTLDDDREIVIRGRESRQPTAWLELFKSFHATIHMQMLRCSNINAGFQHEYADPRPIKASFVYHLLHNKQITINNASYLIGDGGILEAIKKHACNSVYIRNSTIIHSIFVTLSDDMIAELEKHIV